MNLEPPPSRRTSANLETTSTIAKRLGYPRGTQCQLWHMQQPILPSVSNAEFPACLEAEILRLVQEQSSKLQPQYQAVDWTAATAREKLSQAIAPRLQTFDSRAAALHWVQTSILTKLFQAEFLDTEQPNNIQNDLLARLTSERDGFPAAVPVDDPKPAAETQPEAALSSEPSGIAVLLLDAENLQLKPEEEAFLQQHCPYPIQVKLAFANWRKLGTLDQALHSRSYDLIHVPSGKDHADGKMIAMGSTIHAQYPQTKAVLICSSDSIMTSLHSQLAKNKIKAYQVTRANRGLTLASGVNGDREEVVLPKPIHLSLEQAIAHLAKIVTAECQRTQTPVARVTQVAAAFRAQHQLSLKDLALHYQAGEKALHLLEAYPEQFKLHQLGQPAEWFIELMQEPPLALSSQDSTLEPSQKAAPEKAIADPSQSPQPFQSTKALKTALLQCLQQQTSNNHPEVDVTAISIRFRQVYGEPISTVLRQLGLNKKLITFLSNQSEFSVRKDNARWWVRLSQH